MLVLTRKAGESVRIGSDIRLTVVSVGGGQVRLGISAPSRVAIHRDEIYRAIEAANVEAAATTLDGLPLPPGSRTDPSLPEKETR